MILLKLYGLDTTPLPHIDVSANGGLITRVLQVVFAIFGAVALLIITLAGFKYVISRGEPQAVAQAKNTIIYAVIGLVIAVSAEAIVSFVITKAT